MKKINLKITLAIAILFYSAKSFSQTTTTILYDASSNLSTTKCNVFDPPVNVGGQLHTGVIGGAKFSTANGLDLPTSYTYSSSQTKRTDYRISYPFKTGYTYRIEFTAFGDVSNSTAYPSLGASLFTAAGLTFTSTSCGAVYDHDFQQLGSVLIQQLNGTSTTYSPSSANFTSPYNYDYLVLEATCLAAQDITANVYIQKIKIIETPPQVSFNITPANVPITCGTTSPFTFTVNNPGSVTGITNYAWNLGATPNGWKLPDGSAAPATYSTATNTLALTPVCGSVQKDVFATVTANGNNYNTDTSTVSITPPTLSINGTSLICSDSSSYSVTGLPCNASVVWSITPATGVANLSCSSCATTSLSYVDNGVVTLTATVSNVCSQQIVKTKTVAIGHATTTCSEIGGGGSCIQTNFVCPSQLNYWQYAYIPVPGSWGPSGTGYHLEVDGGGYFSNGLTTQDVTSNYFSVWVPSTGSNVRVSGMNACGVSLYTPYVIAYIPKSYGCGSYFSISPNPAKSSITVRPNTSASSDVNKRTDINKPTEEMLIDRISIYNEQGTLVKDRKISKIKAATVNISGLFPGQYVVEITSGTYKERQIIIVQ